MEEFITEIEEEIERNGIDETTPGLSLLVTYKGEVVLSKGSFLFFSLISLI